MKTDIEIMKYLRKLGERESVLYYPNDNLYNTLRLEIKPDKEIVYNIRYTKQAFEELQMIVNSISDVCGQQKALALIDKVEYYTGMLQIFPHTNSIYTSPISMENQYRLINADDVLIFYRMFDERQVVVCGFLENENCQ